MHKEELVAEIVNVVSNMVEGDISFNHVEVSQFRDFPNVTVTLHNLQVTDTLYEDHHIHTVYMNEVSLRIVIINTLMGDLKVDKLSMKDGEINLFVMPDGYNNLYCLKPIKRAKKNNGPGPLSLVSAYSRVHLKNVSFLFREHIKNKRISAHINDLKTRVNPFDEQLIPEVNVDVMMYQMGLNLKNGSFFNGAQVVGTLYPVMDTTDNTIVMNDFDLMIGGQSFNNSMTVFTDKGSFDLRLSLPNALYLPTVNLLSQNIQRRLLEFDFSQELKVNAHISGLFAYRSNPVVKVNYVTENNQMSLVKNNIKLDKLSLKGWFVNRLPHYNANQKESTKDLEIYIDDLRSEFENIPFEIKNSYVIGDASPGIVSHIDVDIQGETKYLNKLVGSKDFFFNGGDFSIQSNINGKIYGLTDILKYSKSKININHCNIGYKPRNLMFRINNLGLELDYERTLLSNLNVQISKDQNVILRGVVHNFASLFNNELDTKPLSTDLEVESQYMSIENLMGLFSPLATQKSDDKKNWYETKSSLNELFKKFHPTLALDIKRLLVADNPFDNVKLRLDYNNDSLELTGFNANYKTGHVGLSVVTSLAPASDSLGIPTNYLKYNLDASGKIEHFTELLRNDKFFFNNSIYTFRSELDGTVNSINDLINKSVSNLHVNMGDMSYLPTKLLLPYKSLDIDLDHNVGRLNQFEIVMPSGRTFQLHGTIKNFSSVFDSKNNLTSNSEMYLSADSLSLEDFLSTFNSTPADSNIANREKGLAGVRSVLLNLYDNFAPVLSLDFKDFFYGSIYLHELKTKVLFNSPTELNFANVSFIFDNKKIKLSGSLNMDNPQISKFNAKTSFKNVSIHKLVEGFDYFGYDELKSPTELRGAISVDAVLKGDVDNYSGLNGNSLYLLVDYNIKGLELNHFRPLVKASEKIFRKDRFENVHFAPLQNRFLFEDNLLYIPRTDLRTNAIDFFVEGILDNTNKSKIWISVPWKNLKRRNLDSIPSEQVFNLSGSKIYINMYADGVGKVHNKLYLFRKDYAPPNTSKAED